MPIRSSVFSHNARQATPVLLADTVQVRTALEWFAQNLTWIDAQQIRLTEIPAPSFEEEDRATAVKELFVGEGLTIHTDKIGNVIGELRGRNEREIVLITAHLDTVFPSGTTIEVQREGERAEEDELQDSESVAFSITTRLVGCSVCGLPSFPILSTTSSPLVTLPRIA